MRVLISGLNERAARRLAEPLASLAQIDLLPSLRHTVITVSKQRPDVLVLLVDDPSAWELIPHLRSVHPSMRIIALVGEADVAKSARQADVHGCADLVGVRAGADDLRRALQMLAKRGRASVGECIALLGGKGGQGTTTLAVNLAAGLLRPKQRTVVVDLHLYLGDVASSIGVQPRPSLNYFLRKGDQLSARLLAEAAPVHPSKLTVLGLETDLDQIDPIGADAIAHLVKRLKEAFRWVVLDCGSNINEVTLSACATADRRLLVVTEQRAAVEGAMRRAAALLQVQTHPDTTSLVVNRAHEDSKLDWPAVERAMGCRVYDRVANDWRAVATAHDRHALLQDHAPRSQATRDIKRLADRLHGRPAPSSSPGQRRGLLQRLGVG